MKHEWRKHEKAFYLPPKHPVHITVPEFRFFTVEGTGNPNDDFFAEYISVLYSVSYAVKMSPKKGTAPEGYFDYTVYPLEGIWDISEEAKKHFSGEGLPNKNDLVFKLMIRQPDFVTPEFAAYIIEQTQKNKPHELLNKLKFKKITEGDCIQMLHIGPYDNEPESFKRMEEFAENNTLDRVSKIHREIYLSDARRVPPEKLKTVLRFNVIASK